MNNLYLRSVQLKDSAHLSELERRLLPLELKSNISIFLGENGSGKSTLLEAIAISIGCNPEGGGRNFNFETMSSHSDFNQKIRLIKGYTKPKDVYFYRSETFYNVISNMNDLDSEFSLDPKISSYYGGRNLHSVSHGEAMLRFLEFRLKEKSLYIFDEPEASLSATSQLTFIKTITSLSKSGCQFLIATHSPIIAQIPNATLYDIDNSLAEVKFKDTTLYSVYKTSINNTKFIEDFSSEEE